MGVCYAADMLKITSLGIELSALQNGNYSDFEANPHLITPETIAAGAEAIGNILIEFYEQLYGEVVDMTETNAKLDALAESMNSVSRGFRTESGVMVVDENVLPADGTFAINVKIPCSNGAKMFAFYANDETKTAIANEYKQENPKQYVTSIIGNCFAPKVTDYLGKQRSYMGMLGYREDINWHNHWMVTDAATTVDNSDGATFVCYAMKAGTYNWTAYYWND
jgi:hypothetical protein